MQAAQFGDNFGGGPELEAHGRNVMFEELVVLEVLGWYVGIVGIMTLVKHDTKTRSPSNQHSQLEQQVSSFSSRSKIVGYSKLIFSQLQVANLAAKLLKSAP